MGVCPAPEQPWFGCYSETFDILVKVKHIPTEALKWELGTTKSEFDTSRPVSWHSST